VSRAGARRGRLAAAVLGLCGLLAAPALPAGAEEDEVALGQPAPPFSLKVLNPVAAQATRFALDSVAGEEPEDPGSRVVLLSFFASWCGPCKKELPLLAELDAMYREAGLRVVSVSIDQDPAGIDAATRLVAGQKATWPVLSDRFNLVARRYLGEQAPLPSVFLIRRDGTIAGIERGYAKDAAAFLRAQVQSALGVKPSGPRAAAKKP
jgi:thiol-disulfide isomerase/thioredoxin